MKQSAAIRRASQQARNAMRELDQQTIEELLQLYEDTAAGVRREIQAAAHGQGMVPEHRLRQLLAQIEEEIEQLAKKRDALLEQRIEEAAALGVRPFTLRGVAAAGGAEAPLTSAAEAVISRAAVEFVTRQAQADGLVLSERVWRLNQGAKEVLQRAIGSAVVRGTTAARAAAELVYQGKPVPPELKQQIAAAGVEQLVAASDLVLTGTGGEVWKAERVFRTEINRAHGEAYMAGAVQTPGFAGLRFLLSPAHPQPDICDMLAAQNIHGLGPGVYPTRELTPWPAHPNTLSFLVMVFEGEISDADRAGKETPLQALQRLAPEIREGVLGKTKAQYFDQGLLTTGMIRAKVSAVNARIERQAERAGRPHPEAIPNATKATIPREKLVSYALNPDHPRGGNKARVFAAALGFTQADADELSRQVLQELPRHPAKAGQADSHGRRYQVDMPLQGRKGRVTVRTAWIFGPGEEVPRLTSIFVAKRSK